MGTRDGNARILMWTEGSVQLQIRDDEGLLVGFEVSDGPS